MPSRAWTAATLLLACSVAAAPDDRIAVAAFSQAAPGGAMPPEWTVLDVPSARAATRYALVQEDGRTVLRAQSDHAASGLTRKLNADPRQYPILRWRWKISNVIRGADISRKDAEDYPARLYVMFDYPVERLPLGERVMLRLARALYDPNLPAATLCYVWNGKAPAGTIAASPYSSRVRIVVAESGGARVNRWVDFERDIAADFKAAFGEPPPAITGIAVAADTDNTGESVTAYFGDISLHKRMVSR